MGKYSHPQKENQSVTHTISSAILSWQQAIFEFNLIVKFITKTRACQVVFDVRFSK